MAKKYPFLNLKILSFVFVMCFVLFSAHIGYAADTSTLQGFRNIWSAIISPTGFAVSPSGYIIAEERTFEDVTSSSGKHMGALHKRYLSADKKTMSAKDGKYLSWIACSGSYAYGDPTYFTFDVGKEALSKLTLEMSAKGSGKNPKANIYCYNPSTKRNIATIKAGFLYPNKIEFSPLTSIKDYTYNIPANCVVDGKVTISFDRTGGNCIGIDSIKIKTEKEEPKEQTRGGEGEVYACCQPDSYWNKDEWKLLPEGETDCPQGWNKNKKRGESECKGSISTSPYAKKTCKELGEYLGKDCALNGYFCTCSEQGQKEETRGGETEKKYIYNYEGTSSSLTRPTSLCPCDKNYREGECETSFESEIDRGEYCYDTYDYKYNTFAKKYYYYSKKYKRTIVEEKQEEIPEGENYVCCQIDKVKDRNGWKKDEWFKGTDCPDGRKQNGKRSESECKGSISTSPYANKTCKELGEYLGKDCALNGLFCTCSEQEPRGAEGEGEQEQKQYTYNYLSTTSGYGSLPESRCDCDEDSDKDECSRPSFDTDENAGFFCYDVTSDTYISFLDTHVFTQKNYQRTTNDVQPKQEEREEPKTKLTCRKMYYTESHPEPCLDYCPEGHTYAGRSGGGGQCQEYCIHDYDTECSVDPTCKEGYDIRETNACGEGIASNIKCGDTISGDLKMDGDLDCSEYVGTRIVSITKDGLTLDCDGHWITGAGDKQGNIVIEGIRIWKANGVTLKNCKVKNTGTGIFIRESDNVVLEDIETKDTGESMEAIKAYKSDNLKIQGTNTIRGETKISLSDKPVISGLNTDEFNCYKSTGASGSNNDFGEILSRCSDPEFPSEEDVPTPPENIRCGETLSKSGTYKLIDDLSCSYFAVKITADDVVFDCDSHTITGQDPENEEQGRGYNTGIWVTGDNVRVKNCNIKNYGIGIKFDNTKKGISENNNIEKAARDALRVYKSTDFNFVGEKHGGTGFNNIDGRLYVYQSTNPIFNDVSAAELYCVGTTGASGENNDFETISSVCNQEDAPTFPVCEKDSECGNNKWCKFGACTARNCTDGVLEADEKCEIGKTSKCDCGDPSQKRNIQPVCEACFCKCVEPQDCSLQSIKDMYQKYNKLDKWCDDGNLNTGDGCTDSCHKEYGYVCANDGTLCEEICGDGIRVGAESMNGGCDDGNKNNGDGCSNICKIEDSWDCTRGGVTGKSQCWEITNEYVCCGRQNGWSNKDAGICSPGQAESNCINAGKGACYQNCIVNGYLGGKMDGKTCVCSNANNALCGTTIIDDIDISGGLIDCEGDGLIVGESGIRISCNDKTTAMISSANMQGSGILIKDINKWKTKYDEDKITIEDCKITNFKSGIKSDVSKYVLIDSNDITANDFGIELKGKRSWGIHPGNTHILRNTITDNSNGIFADLNGRNFIRDNEMKNNPIAINLKESGNLEIGGNTIINSLNYGIYLEKSDNNKIGAEDLGGNKITYTEGFSFKNAKDAGIESSAILLNNSQENTISKNEITDGLNGIRGEGWCDANYRDCTNENTIIENKIKNNADKGIRLGYGEDNIVERNVVTGNYEGLVLEENSRDNKVSHNAICDSSYDYGGVVIKNLGGAGPDPTDLVCDNAPRTTTNNKINTLETSKTNLCNNFPAKTDYLPCHPVYYCCKERNGLSITMDCAEDDRQQWSPYCGFISANTFGKSNGYSTSSLSPDGFGYSFGPGDPKDLGNLGGSGGGGLGDLPAFGINGALDFGTAGNGASCMDACIAAFPGRTIYMAIPVGFTCVCSMKGDGALTSTEKSQPATDSKSSDITTCKGFCSNLGYLYSAYCNDECFCSHDPDIRKKQWGCVEPPTETCEELGGERCDWVGYYCKGYSVPSTDARDCCLGECKKEEKPKEVVNSQQTCTNDCISKGNKGGLWEGGKCTCTDFATLKDKYRRCSCTKTGRNDCPSNQRDGDTWYYWRNVAACSNFGNEWKDAGFTAGRSQGNTVCDDDVLCNKGKECLCQTRGFATGFQSGIYCQCAS